MTAATTPATRRPIQYIALVYGLVFLLVGILGFIPGITTNYDSLAIAGHHSEAMLLGIFQVSVLHNVVHLFYGVAGLAMWRSAISSRDYLRWGGVVYGLLWIYGLVVDHDSNANFVPLNTGDNWLHLGLAVTMIVLSFLRIRDRTATRS